MVLPGGKHGREGGGGRGPDPRRHLSSIKLCKRRYPSRVGGGGGNRRLCAIQERTHFRGANGAGKERKGGTTVCKSANGEIVHVDASRLLFSISIRDTEGEGVGSMVRREFGKFAGKSVIFLSRDLSLTD